MSELPQDWLDELGELLRIPSVSADPAHQDDVEQAAEWVADKIRRSGGEAELVPYGKRPLVVGEIRASSDAANAPTILCYGHFDVQPPAPLELWESDPFEATIRGEWLYARGVADDKGQLWMLLHAAGLLAAEGALPINIRVVSDGEEEVGGQSIVQFLEQDERGADACVIFDGGMETRNLPALSIATRGLAAFNIRVQHRRARPALGDVRQRGAERDPRADDDAGRDPAARRPRARRAAGRHRAGHRRGARGLGAAADRRRRAPRGGGDPVRLAPPRTSSTSAPPPRPPSRSTASSAASPA